MPIAFNCSGCGKPLTVSDAAAGRAGKCPHCKGAIQVPLAGTVTAAAAFAPPPADWGAPAPTAGSGPAAKRKLILIGAGAAAGLLLVILVFLFFSGGGSGLAADLRYLPSQPAMILSARVSDIMATQAYKDLMAEAKKQGAGDFADEMTKGFEKTLGLRLDAVTNFTLGIAGEKNAQPVMVFHTTEKVGADWLAKLQRSDFKFVGGEMKEETSPRKFKEVKVGGQTMHEEETGAATSAYYFPDNYTVVVSDKDTLKTVLERGKKAEISEVMQKTLNQVGTSRAFFAVLDVAKMPKGGLDDPMAKPVLDLMQAVGILGIVGSDLQIASHVVTKDSKSAEDLKKTLDGLIAAGKLSGGIPREMQPIIDRLKIANIDNVVTITGTFTGTEAVNLMPRAAKAKKMGAPVNASGPGK